MNGLGANCPGMNGPGAERLGFIGQKQTNNKNKQTIKQTNKETNNNNKTNYT